MYESPLEIGPLAALGQRPAAPLGQRPRPPRKVEGRRRGTKGLPLSNLILFLLLASQKENQNQNENENGNEKLHVPERSRGQTTIPHPSSVICNPPVNNSPIH